MIRSNNSDVTEYFSRMSDQEKVVCELGFGMNPNIKDLASIHVVFVGYGEIDFKGRR